MPAQLSPCPGCQRHIRITEASCPFCGVAVEVSGSVSQSASLREHATAIFVGVTLAIAGCNTKPEDPKKPIPVDVKPDPATMTSQPATKPDPGAVVTPPPASKPVPDPTATHAEYGAPMKPEPVAPAPKYGAPPPPKPDPIAPAPEYGAPMPPAIHTKYGAPPPPAMMPRYGAPPVPKK
jgi:hypothetical protein